MPVDRASLPQRVGSSRGTHLFAWLGALALLGPVLANQPPAGTRFTYYASTASVAGSRSEIIGRWNGMWVYQEMGPASGQGFTQVDIVYSDAEVCVGNLTSFGVDTYTSSVVLLGTSGFVTRGGSCSDFWVNPAGLNQWQPQLTDTLSVVRGPREHRGTVHDIVGIALNTGDASSFYTYDTNTGLLLVGSTATIGTPVLTPGAGGRGVGVGAGNAILTFTDLVNLRQLMPANQNATLPAHVRNMRELVYGCIVGTQMDATRLDMRCEQRARVVASGPQWLSMSVTFRQENPITNVPDSSVSDVVLGVTQVGGVYMDPQLLASLRPQQLLDVDPITNARTSVVQMDGRVTTLMLDTGVEQTYLSYDMSSGWLAEMYREKRLGLATEYVRLVLQAVN